MIDLEKTQRDRPDLLPYVKVMRHPTGYVAGQLELTSRCEQRCGTCQSWIDHEKGVQRGEWDLEEVQDFFLDLAGTPTFEHLTLTGGDPLSWGPWMELVEWFLDNRTLFPFTLRLNTALPFNYLGMDDGGSCFSQGTGGVERGEEGHSPLFGGERAMELLSRIDDLRVSLDGVDRETYRRTRGVDRDPGEVLDMIVRIANPRTSTLTCVSQRNIDTVPNIVQRLEEVRDKVGLRRAIFIPVRDKDDRQLTQIVNIRPVPFLEKWEKLQEQYSGSEWNWTSFGEQVEENELHGCYDLVDCWISRITFHVKMDGWLYVCCLMGGEAIQTRQSYRLGNVRMEHIHSIWEQTMGKKDGSGMIRHPYRDKESPCSKICLWKQGVLNVMGHLAGETRLTMP